jgi:hypothetical protein
MLKINRNGELISGNRFLEMLHTVLCCLIGHKYRYTRLINHNISELQCPRCGKEFAMHTDAEMLLPLDKDLTKLHNEILLNKP